MGRVVKSPASHRIDASLVDARTRAAALLAEATRQCDALLVEAHAEAERIAARASVESALHVRELAARIDAEAEATSLRRQNELAALAVGIAEKLVLERFAEDPTRVVALVRDAMSKLPRAASFCVRVHPDDAATALAAFPSFEVRPDATLARGDAIVSSEVGRVDARLHVRLAAIREALGIASERSG